MKITFMNISHILHQITSKFLQGLIFMVIFTLILLDVDETESENWMFLMHGRIGKHPMQSLYTRYYRTL